MNDKCCISCIYQHDKECPLELYGMRCTWNFDNDSCSKYTPLPDKPWKIDPLDGLVNSLDLTPMIFEINELIAAWNGREK